MSLTVKTHKMKIYDTTTLIALLLVLVAYPLLYSTDFFGSIFLPLMPTELVSSLYNENSRAEWWYLHISNFVFHWVAFSFVWFALKKNNQKWSSIGVNWNWFSRHNLWFIMLFVFLVVSAFIMPSILYDSNPPIASKTHFIGPVSTIERLVMIVTAVTAAITEEVMFRGFAFTRLKKWISNPWLILPITIISFVLIHGEPRSIEQIFPLVVGAMAFSIPFIVMGLKRLEIIILVHFFIDASLVIAP